MILWPHRDRISVEVGGDCMLFDGKVVVPGAARRAVLKALHVGHLRRVTILCKARKICYWPGLAHNIKEFVQRCD